MREAKNGRFIEGYLCVPNEHNETSDKLQSLLKKSSFVNDLFYSTATFSRTGKLYFPENGSNQYFLATLRDIENISQILSEYPNNRTSLIFRLGKNIFEKPQMEKLNYVSVDYLVDNYNSENINDLKNIFLRIRGEDLRNVILSEMKMIKNSTKYTFPYSDKIMLLELEGTNHMAENKYCQKLRIEALRKGMRVENLVSFSITEEIK